MNFTILDKAVCPAGVGFPLKGWNHPLKSVPPTKENENLKNKKIEKLMKS